MRIINPKIVGLVLDMFVVILLLRIAESTLTAFEKYNGHLKRPKAPSSKKNRLSLCQFCNSLALLGSLG